MIEHEYRFINKEENDRKAPPVAHFLLYENKLGERRYEAKINMKELLDAPIYIKDKNTLDYGVQVDACQQ